MTHTEYSLHPLARIAMIVAILATMLHPVLGMLGNLIHP